MKLIIVFRTVVKVYLLPTGGSKRVFLLAIDICALRLLKMDAAHYSRGKNQPTNK